MDRRGVVQHGLPAAVHTADRHPHAHRAPEVIGYVQRHHLLHTQRKGRCATDLETNRRDSTISEKDWGTEEEFITMLTHYNICIAWLNTFRWFKCNLKKVKELLSSLSLGEEFSNSIQRPTQRDPPPWSSPLGGPHHGGNNPLHSLSCSQSSFPLLASQTCTFWDRNRNIQHCSSQ